MAERARSTSLSRKSRAYLAAVAGGTGAAGVPNGLVSPPPTCAPTPLDVRPATRRHKDDEAFSTASRARVKRIDALAGLVT